MRKQNNQSPLISVVLPVYNGKDTIRLCVDSMLAQDFKDFELVIVDVDISKLEIKNYFQCTKQSIMFLSR